MSKLADADARRLIDERLDLNVLVEAGAGSGKTHSLAHRMASGIVSGQYVVEEMAAVTFTRKAAAELRGRFQLALEAKRAGAGPEERRRIEKALANLEHLFAGTIHSFCAHLLHERPVEANIAPGFTELDELEDAQMRKRAWRDHFSRLRGEGSPVFEQLQQARVAAKDLDGAFAIVCTHDEVAFPGADAPMPDLEAARKAIDAFWHRLQALMPKPVAPDAKCKTLERARRFKTVLRAATGGGAAHVVDALRCWEKPPDVTMKWWADDHARQKEVRGTVEALMADFQAATVAPVLAQWRQYLYGVVITVLTDAREVAREQRRAALALNYGDLLSAAASLLRHNAAVRAALQRKYRWLLVDEFQDTDPIQADVMLLLAADEDAQATDAGIDPMTVRLRPGALFVVGDPKQSIYRFRRADIDVYNRVREAIRKSGGRVVSLTTSFRAMPALCGWTNEVFGHLLPAEAAAHQAAFSPLEPDPGWKPARPLESDAEWNPLRTLTVPENVAKTDVPEWDAAVIAGHIRAEVEGGRAAYDDFLVLTRKKKHLPGYAAALQARQVPAEVSGAGAFGGSPIVRALLDLLHVLGDPGDALGLVGVLRGPLFGISDAALFEHRQGGGYFGFGGRGPEGPTREALERLGGFLRLTRTLPLPSAVERILEDTGFLALAAAGAPDAAPAGDVLHAVDLVRAVAEDGGSLADAAAALEEAAESSDVESVPLEPGRRDVVRVMNLHKAKGLEARVVFLADPAGGTKKTVDVRIVREGGTARGYLAIYRELGEYATELLAHPQGWDAHQRAEMEYVEAEEMRLLYVAATRARERLVVSRWAKDSKGPRPWAALEPHLGTAAELAGAGRSKTTHGGGEHTAATLSRKARIAARTTREARLHAASAPSWAVESVTGLAHPVATATGTAAAGGVRAAAKGPADAVESRVDAGAAWGSLVHGLLEHAMRRTRGTGATAREDATQAARGAGVTRVDLERLARWLTVETPELGPVINDAVTLVEAVMTEPFWKDACDSPDVHVEVPFARVWDGRPAGQENALPTILHGVIDLVYRAPDGWHIIDYKTDQASDDCTLQQRHAAQLESYRLAWEQATREPVADARVVSVRRA